MVGFGLVLAAALLRQRDRAGAAAVSVALVGAGLLTVAGKHLVGRARPAATIQSLPLEAGFSFPSGHTLFVTVLWVGAALVLWPHLRGTLVRVLAAAAAATVALAVGGSRLWLGYHWPTDVPGSLLLGTAWLAVMVLALQSPWFVARRCLR